jgi:hypothetical protein
MLEEKEIDKIGKIDQEGRSVGEASATRRGVVSGPPAMVVGKKHVELFFVLYDS